jgi:organic radical activating enzyme
MCWEGLSSGYFQLAKDLGLKVDIDEKFLEVPNDRFEEIFEIIKNTLRTHSAEMHFYFAGGEPLLMPQHHKILQHLIDNEYYNVRLRYNTNLTTLKYKKTNWADIWKKFDNVVIDGSIDAVGPAGEFQRMNSSWSHIKENIQKLIDNDITVTFNMVQTMITYPYIIDTLKEISAMFTEDYLQRHMKNQEKNIRLVGTHHPAYLTLLNTPKEFIDYSILDQIDELGYNSTSLRGLLSEYDEFNADRANVDKRWQRLKNLDDGLRIKKATGFNDLLPWFDEHMKRIITNGR